MSAHSGSRFHLAAFGLLVGLVPALLLPGSIFALFQFFTALDLQAGSSKCANHRAATTTIFPRNAAVFVSNFRDLALGCEHGCSVALMMLEFLHFDATVLLALNMAGMIMLGVDVAPWDEIGLSILEIFRICFVIDFGWHGVSLVCYNLPVGCPNNPIVFSGC
ncbi:hypothetical protein Nepgr_033907 [Nepenthes gracilis]|uniref:Uncharacterized protein n=1 Tax=Nepenthes gracilis TaxID=150966 RepID=A0AAD3TN46_NEPGR|nr:hypothetical protein Nepgr_033907 [Nepenthes gracilis]